LFTDGTKRWMTARTLATGIRIFPTGQQLNRSGVLTLGILPGNQSDRQNTAVYIPSPQALR